MSKRSVITLLFLESLLFSVFAQQPKVLQTKSVQRQDSVVVPVDSFEVSLLTASPGELVYEKFGHTALRVRKINGSKVDLVFNYGLFSFNTPNFLYRFVKGETDYRLGISDMPYFVLEYAMRDSRVKEQVLNISNEDARRIFDALQENYLPENRVYRYNYFYDNCSTRPRDIIENNITGKVVYRGVEADTLHTYRDMAHAKVGDEPWLEFGIDLTLGVKADEPIGIREKMFLPEFLSSAFDSAVIRCESATVPLVAREGDLIKPQYELDNPRSGKISHDVIVRKMNPWLTPGFVGWSLFYFMVILSIYQMRQGRVIRLLDFVLFTVAGAAGCILFFLNFYSTHPTVDENYNCIWLQPLDLLAGVFVWIRGLKKLLYYYHFINFAVLLVFLIATIWLSQVLNPAFYPFIGVLMLQSAVHIYLKPAKKIR